MPRTASKTYWAIFVVQMFLLFERLKRQCVIFAPLLLYQVTVRFVEMSQTTFLKCVQRPVASTSITFTLFLSALRTSSHFL